VEEVLCANHNLACGEVGGKVWAVSQTNLFSWVGPYVPDGAKIEEE